MRHTYYSLQCSGLSQIIYTSMFVLAADRQYVLQGGRAGLGKSRESVYSVVREEEEEEGRAGEECSACSQCQTCDRHHTHLLKERNSILNTRVWLSVVCPSVPN